MHALPDGTLIAASPSWIASRAQDGRTFSHRFLEGDTLGGDPTREGIIVTHRDGASCTFLRTPDLVEVDRGPCTLPQTDRGSVVFRGTTLVFQRAGTPFRVPVQNTPFENVLLTTSGHRVAVEGSQGTHLLDSETGKVLATLSGPLAYYGGVSMAAMSNAALYYLAGDNVRRVDLRTGADLGAIRVGCRKVAQSGNSSMPPEPHTFDVSRDAQSLFVNPAGDRMVVGCGSDIIVFRNGVRTGIIPRVAPGCDNIGIPGMIGPDGISLVLMGCGGIARIDLDKRAYRCADNDGIAGGAYAAMTDHDTRAPFGRKSLPRCLTAPEAARFLDDTGSGLWAIETETTLTVGAPQGSYSVDGETLPTRINADVVASLRAGTVTARAIKGGAEVFTWKLW